MSIKDIKEDIKSEFSEKTGIYNQDDIQHLAHHLGCSLKSFLADKQHKLMDVKNQYEGTIKENPISSAATAFTAGLIIGLLLKKR